MLRTLLGIAVLILAILVFAVVATPLNAPRMTLATFVVIVPVATALLFASWLRPHPK